jgi:hypothetical protein
LFHLSILKSMRKTGQNGRSITRGFGQYHGGSA